MGKRDQSSDRQTGPKATALEVAAQKRLQASESRILKKGIRPDPEIGTLEALGTDSEAAVCRPASDLARRLLVLIAVQAVAQAALDDLDSTQKACEITIQWLKEHNLWEGATTDEEKYFFSFPSEAPEGSDGSDDDEEKDRKESRAQSSRSNDGEGDDDDQPTQFEMVASQLVWRVESIHTLLWLISVVSASELPWPSQPAQIRSFVESGKVPFVGADPAKFLAAMSSIQPRDLASVLQELDFTMRLEAMKRNAENEMISARGAKRGDAEDEDEDEDEGKEEEAALDAVDQDVLSERRHCLRWALGLVEWDAEMEDEEQLEGSDDDGDDDEGQATIV